MKCNQIRSAQWTVQKNKKQELYKSNTTQEHIYGKKKEIRVKCAIQKVHNSCDMYHFIKRLFFVKMLNCKVVLIVIFKVIL